MLFSIQSNVTITQSEVEDAMDDMKKGGYDFPLPVVNILPQLFLPTLVTLMNIMFISVTMFIHLCFSSNIRYN